MGRGVDDAMAAERPEKKTVRRLWVEEVRRAEGVWVPKGVPLYLTLPGAQGGDIRALADEGLVELAENGAIVDAEEMRLVAVESAPGAVIELQRSFPGLKILEETVGNLLHSTSPLAWPQGETKRFFRARVVNLDLNAPLEAKVQNGQLIFPVLAWIHKLALLHAVAPRVDWSLCLTLHGEVSWTARGDQMACRFLCENFARDAEFSARAKATLGEEIHSEICARPGRVAVRMMEAGAQQRVLMVLVPKQIAFDAHSTGWGVDTVENLRYGGSEGRAPMVTWVLRFSWDTRARTQPDKLYRESLVRSLLRCGSIDSSGVLRHG
jgi:hypothetical protein